MVGQWDEALRLAEELLREAPDHYLAPAWILVRAHIELARDDVDAALADVVDALGKARLAADPQAVEPSLVEAAWTYVEAGRPQDAEPLFAELLEIARTSDRHGYPGTSRVVELAVVGSALGRREAVAATLDDPSLVLPYHQSARMILRGDVAAAADLHAAAGEVRREVVLRLVAGDELAGRGRRHEADEQLRRGLALAAELRATRWLRRGRALLAASA
jgi:tetratricopeptide (TPR) repeat protein